MANIYSEDFKFKPALEEIKPTDGWLVALAKIAGETIKDVAKTKTGAITGALFAADTIASGSSAAASVFTNVSNTVMAAAPDVIPTIQNVAGALFEAANTNRQERSKVIKLDPKLKKLFFTAPMKKYIKSECDKLFSAAKAKDGTVTKEVVGASTNAAKSLVGKKEQEVRKKISKFREVTMTIDGYDLIVFGRKDGISRVAVVFFSQAKKTPILKTIKIPSTEDLKKGKAVKEAAEDIEMILPVDEGWKNFLGKVSKYSFGAMAGAAAGSVIHLVTGCPGIASIPLCTTIGAMAPELKAIADKKLKGILEQPAVKKQILDSCKAAFDEAKKEDSSIVREFENGVKTTMNAIKDEGKLRSIKQKLTNFSKVRMVIDGWSIIAFGDTKSIERVSLVLWSNEKKQAVVKSLPVPNLSKEEVKECAIYLESLYPEHFAGASFGIQMEAIQIELESLSSESQTVVTEGLVDKAKELKEKFDRNIRPKIEAALKWIYDQIVAIINKLDVFRKTKIEGLHIEVKDYKTLNNTNSGIKTLLALAAKVKGEIKMEVDGEDIAAKISDISSHRSPLREYKSRDIREWSDAIKDTCKFNQEALKTVGKAMMAPDNDNFDTYLFISSNILVPYVNCIGEDVNKIMVALSNSYV